VFELCDRVDHRPGLCHVGEGVVESVAPFMAVVADAGLGEGAVAVLLGDAQSFEVVERDAGDGEERIQQRARLIDRCRVSSGALCWKLVPLRRLLIGCRYTFGLRGSGVPARSTMLGVDGIEASGEV